MNIQNGFTALARRWLKASSSMGVVLFLGISSMSQSALADNYQNTWGPEVGSQIALLAAKDQNGDAQKLQDLTGSKGVLVFYNRSADW
ncbi:MAG: hypothetical protein ACI8RT_000547 [Candidatus Azotimanducaceae bacterium]|jgi:hypothetical protein|tara:strand:- start:6341 stop:6604 length:264 start_codon:yes stop_codon:yes gene_type:complete